MKTLGLLFGLCLAVVVAGCSETTKPEPEVPHGRIRVDSFPDSAAVWLDGRDTGQLTECIIDNVPVGEHVVTLKHRHYAAWSDTVQVFYEELPRYVLAHLSLAPASLTITSQPTGAQIRLSYHNIGLTTPARIDSLFEIHQRVDLHLPGHYPTRGDVVLELGETTAYTSTLTPAPDRTVVYSRNDSLFTLSLDGLRETLLAGDMRDQNMVWSPNGLYLAYASTAGVTILNSDGSVRATLNFGSGARADDFTWSHAGDKLAVGAYVDGIYVYDATTNETTRVLRTGGYTYDHNPTFSPGDSLIGYVHHEWETHAWICVMRADGSNAHAVSEQLGTGYDSHLFLSWVLPDVMLWASHSGLHRFFVSTGFRDTIIPADSYAILVVSPDYTRFAFKGDKYYLGTVADWQYREVNLGGPYLTWEPDGSSLCGQYYDALRWVPWDGEGHTIVFDLY